jgi:hypothetical protein
VIRADRGDEQRQERLRAPGFGLQDGSRLQDGFGLQAPGSGLRDGFGLQAPGFRRLRASGSRLQEAPGLRMASDSTLRASAKAASCPAAFLKPEA